MNAFMNITKQGKIHNPVYAQCHPYLQGIPAGLCQPETKAEASYLIEKEFNALPNEHVREKVKGMLERSKQVSGIYSCKGLFYDQGIGRAY